MNSTISVSEWRGLRTAFSALPANAAPRKVLLAILIFGWGAHANAFSSTPEGSVGTDLNYWSGYSLFRSPWVSAPASTTGRDGLGPYFNAHSCHACHHEGGGGRDLQAFVVRVGDGRTSPLQNLFGQQLQPYAVNGLKPEVQVDLVWGQKTLRLLNGEAKLRVPVVRWTFRGALPPGSRSMSIRVAPPLFGMGLLNEIDETDILAFADPNDTDGDGISGRGSLLRSDRDGEQLGRFGYKAEHSDLVSQVAFALHEDLGLTTKYFPQQNCADRQRNCQRMPNGDGGADGVEVSTEKLTLLVSFVGRLPLPSSPLRENPHPGEETFHEIGCADCHRPTFPASETSGQHSISPYSDLLLHDLGNALSDHRTLPNAEPDEWRTTPLWGLHRKLAAPEVYLLHDGRAGSLEEAIGWHGGEALQSRRLFETLNPEQRSTLLEFLSQL